MKKIALFCLSLFAAVTGFADNLVLENQTPYPNVNQKSKLAIQWAYSAKEVDEANKAVQSGSELNPDTLQVLTQAGTVTLTIPPKAQYFRVLAWSKGVLEPDFLTNWVDIVPNKTYTLQTDHLIPSILMQGSGC